MMTCHRALVNVSTAPFSIQLHAEDLGKAAEDSLDVQAPLTHLGDLMKLSALAIVAL